MKNIKHFTIAAVLILALSVTGFGQTATTKTTLSSAVSSGTANSIVVVSASGFSASTATQEYDIWVDGELMKVNSISATTIGVTRGKSPTRATAHPSGAPVYFGPAGASPFVMQTPSPGTACTATAYQYLPLIVVQTGDITTCTASKWIRFASVPMQSFLAGRTTVTNANYTILITDYIVAYTSLTAGRTATLPSPTGFAGKVLIIKDETGNATATGSKTITISGTVDGSSNPTISTAYGVSRLYSDGSAWFTW